MSGAVKLSAAQRAALAALDNENGPMLTADQERELPVLIDMGYVDAQRLWVTDKGRAAVRGAPANERDAFEAVAAAKALAKPLTEEQRRELLSLHDERAALVSAIDRVALDNRHGVAGFAIPAGILLMAYSRETLEAMLPAARVVVTCWRCEREWDGDARAADAKCPHCGATAEVEEHAVREETIENETKEVEP